MKKVRCGAFALVVLAVAVLAGQFSGGFLSAYAEENASGFTVSPMHQKIVLVPGEKYKASVEVSNPVYATYDLSYTVSVGSFGQYRSDGGVDDYGGVDVSTVTDSNQIMEWIKLDKDSGTVPPNGSDTVSFVIDVPKDAPAGGQYATILVKSDTDDGGTGGVNVQNVMHIASIVYAEVAGETREEGKILDNSFPSFLTSGPLETASMVRNDGNVHTDAEYTLQVWPLFSGEEICTNEENPDTSLVMPGTERYHSQSCDLPLAGVFNVKQMVKIFGEVSIVEKMIVVCPIWLAFIIVFAVILLIIWLVLKLRSHKSSKAPRSESSASAGDAE